LSDRDDLKRPSKRSASGRKASDLQERRKRQEEQDADALLYQAWKKTYENARKGKRVG
jgi:hypothetical protein